MQDLPLGFGMALAQNEKAMQYFCSLPEEKRVEIVDHTHQIHSRKEMHEYVSHLGAQP